MDDTGESPGVGGRVSGGLADHAAALRAGRVDPTAFVGERYRRIDDVEADVRAWVDGAKPRAWVEAEAAALADRHPAPADRPPLFGVPVGVKDVFHVDGMATRAGSELPPSELVGPQATVVDDLRAAGALVLGKTVTTEFAYLEPGPTRNPHDPDHTPGGSSSGSAAAVAAGACPLALGTQTVGSVVRPATFCGVVGYKPSYGRIPTGGVIPLAPSVDHVGLFTRDVAGMALAASVACDGWSDDVATSSLPTVGVPDDGYLAQADPEGRHCLRAAVEALDEAGYEVRRVAAFGDVDGVNRRHGRLVAAEAATTHHELYERHADLYGDATADLVEEGRDVPVEAVARGRRSRTDLRARLGDLMAAEGVDVWVAPGAPGTAPEGLDSTGDPVMNLPWTHAGLPTLALPAGTVDDLPVGVQCVAAFGADERLLSWGEGVASVVADATPA